MVSHAHAVLRQAQDVLLSAPVTKNNEGQPHGHTPQYMEQPGNIKSSLNLQQCDGGLGFFYHHYHDSFSSPPIGVLSPRVARLRH